MPSYYFSLLLIILSTTGCRITNETPIFELNTAGVMAGEETGGGVGGGAGEAGTINAGNMAGDPLIGGTDIGGELMRPPCPLPSLLEDQFTVSPGEVINLDARGSFDPSSATGEPVAYEWTIIQRPEGSRSVILEAVMGDGDGVGDDPTTPTAVLIPDLIGEYQIQLTIVGADGSTSPSESCPSDNTIVSISVIEMGGLLLELVWDTPNDPDQEDTEGTDVDIHFLHPQGEGRWNSSPWDCYFANTEASWSMERGGNPILIIDDNDGSGPESIILEKPMWTDEVSPDDMYRLGAHYYSSGGQLGGTDFGVSFVIARIYFGEVLVWEQLREMTATGHFWEAAGIIWTASERRVVEIDRYYSEIPAE